MHWRKTRQWAQIANYFVKQVNRNFKCSVLTELTRSSSILYLTSGTPQNNMLNAIVHYLKFRLSRIKENYNRKIITTKVTSQFNTWLLKDIKYRFNLSEKPSFINICVLWVIILILRGLASLSVKNWGVVKNNMSTLGLRKCPHSWPLGPQAKFIKEKIYTSTEKISIKNHK